MVVCQAVACSNAALSYAQGGGYTPAQGHSHRASQGGGARTAMRFSRGVAAPFSWSQNPRVCFCEGFRMPARWLTVPRAPRAGVRKPPREETALGERAAVERALWGFGRRRGGVRVAARRARALIEAHAVAQRIVAAERRCVDRANPIR